MPEKYLLAVQPHLWHKTLTEVALTEHEQLEMENKVDTETQGWDDGKEFADGLRAAVIEELRTLRRLKYSPEYIDAWKLSAQNIFYSLTDEGK